jgi:hypothetical protein
MDTKVVGSTKLILEGPRPAKKARAGLQVGAGRRRERHDAARVQAGARVGRATHRARELLLMPTTIRQVRKGVHSEGARRGGRARSLKANWTSGEVHGPQRTGV